MNTTTAQDHLLDILNTTDSAISFHGGDDSKSDLRGSLKERGYESADRLAYEEYEIAAAELVSLGLACWKGNNWLNLTDAGSKYAEDLFNVEV